MTSSLLESQLERLRASLATLASLCQNLPSGKHISDLLNRLPLAPSPIDDVRTSSLEYGVALNLVDEAKACVDLLSSYQKLGDNHSNSPYEELTQGLESIERELGQEVRRQISRRVYGLYVIIDPEITGGRDPVDVAKSALQGGARMIQLRDKLHEKGRTLPLARSLRDLCSRYDALLIINDHADLAVVVDAHGLHVGQGDLPVAEARRILKPLQIIGRSNHLLREILESQSQGADHVALGAVYPTATKASIRSRATLGPEAVRRAKEAVDVPLVAIGGINEDNLEPVVQAGADAICVTGAVGLADNPEEASHRLVEKILHSGGKA